MKTLLNRRLVVFFTAAVLCISTVVGQSNQPRSKPHTSGGNVEEKVINNFKNNTVDSDEDDIDDKLESWLLARYRPYFKFSSDESIFPIDAAGYIRQCDFKLCGTANGDCDKDAGTFMSPITDINSILLNYPDLNITKSPAKSAYHLSPRVGHDALNRYSPLSSPSKDAEKNS